MKKVISWTVLLVFVLVSMESCHSTSDPSKYMKAVNEDKSISKLITIGNIEYDFRLVPAEAMALRGSANGGQIDKAAYEKRLKELKGFLFLNINMQLKDQSGPILKYGLKTPSEYEQRVMYYEFYAKSDIKIKCDGKETPVQSYEYENRQGLSPYNTIVLAFPVAENTDQMQISFSDRAFNNLFIKATFENSDINNLPKFTLN